MLIKAGVETPPTNLKGVVQMRLSENHATSKLKREIKFQEILLKEETSDLMKVRRKGIISGLEMALEHVKSEFNKK